MGKNKTNQEFFHVIVVGSTNPTDIRRSVITCSSRDTIKDVKRVIKSYKNNGTPYGNWHKELLSKGQDLAIKELDAISYEVVNHKVVDKNFIRRDYRLKYIANLESKGFTIVSGKGLGRNEKTFF